MQQHPPFTPMAADGRGTKSAAVRERAVMAMLTESSIGAAARRAGVGARTLRRWIADDAEF